jgi:hypothetical protein
VSAPAERPAPGPATDDRCGEAEPPPILGRWSRLYLLVVLELLVVIFLLYRLTRTFD